MGSPTPGTCWGRTPGRQVWGWRGGDKVPLAGSVVARFLGESTANLRGRPRWGGWPPTSLAPLPHLAVLPTGTPPPLGQHMSMGLVTQSRTHWVGREPSTAESRVRLIGEAIGYGVGRGRGQAGILGPPSSLPPLLEEPTSKALSACRQPSHSRPAAARPGKPLAGVDWAWSRTWRAFRTPPEDPRIMLETHRQE